MTKSLIIEWEGWGNTTSHVVYGPSETPAQATLDRITAGLDTTHIFRRIPASDTDFVLSSDASWASDEQTTQPTYNKGLFSLTFAETDVPDVQIGTFFDLHLQASSYAGGTTADVWNPPDTTKADSALKFGNFYVVERTASGGEVTLTFRAIRLTSQGATECRLTSRIALGPNPATRIFIFPYIPRISTSVRPEAWLTSCGVAQAEWEAQAEEGVTDWTRQLSQEIPPVGGIASSTGFQITMLFQGRPLPTADADIRARNRPDQTRGIENLISTYKFPVGAVQISDLITNKGISLVNDPNSSRQFVWSSSVLTRFFESEGQRRWTGQTSPVDLTPLIYDLPSSPVLSDVENYLDSVMPFFFGSQTTEFSFESTPSTSTSNRFTGDRAVNYRLLPGAFGSDPIYDLPVAAEPWSAPPTLPGRRARIWVVDIDDPTLLQSAELIFDGLAGSARIDQGLTQVQIQFDDYLTWMRVNSNRADAQLSTLAGDNSAVSAASGVSDDALSKGVFVSRLRPFDIFFKAKFEIPTRGSTQVLGGASVALENFFPQWIKLGSYAFPCSRLVRGGSSYYDTVEQSFTDFSPQGSPYNFARDLYMVTHGLWIENNTYREFPQDNTSNFLSGDEPARYRAPLASNALLERVRKLGIPIGDEPDDSFNYASIEYDRITLNHPGNPDDIRLLGSASFALANPERDFLNRPRVGYLNLPSVPSEENANSNLRDNSKNTQLWAGDATTLINVPEPFPAVQRHKISQVMYRQFAEQILTKFEPEPIHIFFGSLEQTELTTQRYSDLALERFGRREGLTRYVSTDGFRSIASSCVISVAEVILQVLTSTGTFSYGDSGSTTASTAWENFEGFAQRGFYSVIPGFNGPFDLLPIGFGQGIPIANVDVDQILNYSYQIKDGSTNFERLIALSDIYLRDVTMTMEDVKDPEDWLVRNILQPFGLGLFYAGGKIKVATMDGFRNFEGDDPRLIIGNLDLHSDDLGREPSVLWESPAENLIQDFRIKGKERSYVYYDKFPNSKNQTELPLIKRNYAKVIVSSAAQTSRGLTPTAKNVDNVREVEVDWILNFRPGTGVGAPYSELAKHPLSGQQNFTPYFSYVLDPRDENSIFILTWNSTQNSILLSLAGKIVRWTVARPRITFDLAPWYFGYDLVEPGAQLQYQLDNFPSIAAERGGRGVILVTNVQRHIESGVKSISGYVIAQDPPVFTTVDLWSFGGDEWVKVSDTIFELTAGGGSPEAESWEDTILKDAVGWKLVALDEYGVVLADDLRVNSISRSGATFTVTLDAPGVVSSDVKYLILDRLDRNEALGVKQPEVNAYWGDSIWAE